MPRKAPSTKSADTPDPLRNLRVAEVIAITDHRAFSERPEDSEIDDETWQAAVEEVRAAVRALQLDIPIEVDKRNFLQGVCREVDGLVRKSGKVDKQKLKDPAIAAVRERIGMLVSVRVRIGRNSRFEKLKKVLKRKKGKVTLIELEKNHDLKALVTSLRIIANGFGTTADQKRLMWEYVLEFLAEQTGLEKVEIERERDFKDSADENSPGARMHRLGIDLAHGKAIGKTKERFDESLEETLGGVSRMLEAFDVLLKGLRDRSERAQRAVNLLELRVSKREGLDDYFRHKKEIDDAASVLRDGDSALSKNDKRAYQTALSGLEKEFTGPLETFKGLEASLDEATQQKADLEELIRRFEDQRWRVTGLNQLKPFRTEAPATGDAGNPVAPATPVATGDLGGEPGSPHSTSPSARRSARITAAGDPSRGAAQPKRSESNPLLVNDRVSHKTYGDGIVLRVDALHQSAEVQFDRRGIEGTKDIRWNYLTLAQK
ncbi:MAG: hypothetical protein WC285_05460 [Candidatus Gracilibacteria bacterium]|jgi:hypothetical protein